MDFIHRDLKGAVKTLYHPPLIAIARWWRGQLAQPRFIGVTGSAGKTTTSATLAQRFRSVSSVDSNNQLYNIARTLLAVFTAHPILHSGTRSGPTQWLQPDAGAAAPARGPLAPFRSS
jgi:hypothetical protein